MFEGRLGAELFGERGLKGMTADLNRSAFEEMAA